MSTIAEPQKMGGRCEEIITLKTLVKSSSSVQMSATLEDAHRFLLQRGLRFLAVLSGTQFMGLCSLEDIGRHLGSRFGFSIYGKRSICNFLCASTIVIKHSTRLPDILAAISERSDEVYFNDVVLTDEHNDFIGLIPVISLLKVQHRMLIHKLEEVQIQ